MRYLILLRAAIEVDDPAIETEEAAVGRARAMAVAVPALLTAARIIEAPLRHGERLADPPPLPPVNRAHYRDAGRPVMRDRRGA